MPIESRLDFPWAFQTPERLLKWSASNCGGDHPPTGLCPAGSVALNHQPAHLKLLGATVSPDPPSRADRHMQEFLSQGGGGAPLLESLA